MGDFTHLDKENQPTMVDVSAKDVTKRFAKAVGRIDLPAEVLKHFKDGEMSTKKGPVVQTAIIAGTMGVKKTSELIPFCHPLIIEKCKFHTEQDDKGLIVSCEVGISGKTGVEMEALTGVSTALLTIYDMCKAFSQKMVIGEIRLEEKYGGKTNYKV